MTVAGRPAVMPEVLSSLGRCNTGRQSETNCFWGSLPICCKAPVQTTPHTPNHPEPIISPDVCFYLFYY